jgi:organic hydroperoxide reductase OsmC/OhrA
MHEYTAHLSWTRAPDERFVDNRYSRRHALSFDGGAEIAGSSSPLSVPLPMSDASAVDPEEMFVASISSCHMLWFLGLAAKRKFCVDRYADAAVGVMEKNAEGRVAVTRVTLRPEAVFSGESMPSETDIESLHHEAHESCYIANSVKTEVVCQPVFSAR